MHLGSTYPNQPPPTFESPVRSVGAVPGNWPPGKTAAEVRAKETAAQFAHRELSQILQRLEINSNRLSAAKKRLQEHFGLPVSDSTKLANCADATPPMPQTMDGIRSWLDGLDARFQSVAEGLEELV